VSDVEHSISVSIPLDTDGFLRRECPTCEREFKWLPADGEAGDAEPAPEAGYFCPYCVVQAPNDQWFTKAQADHLASVGAHEFLGPLMDEMKRSFSGLNRPDSMIKVSVTGDAPQQPEPLSEQDDMRRVDFACHPGEPVKVLDEWDREVHCLLCGQAAAGA
jgi:hypothetical protein